MEKICYFLAFHATFLLKHTLIDKGAHSAGRETYFQAVEQWLLNRSSHILFLVSFPAQNPMFM